MLLILHFTSYKNQNKHLKVRLLPVGVAEQEQQQAEAAYDDTDSTPHMTESAEVQQLRHQLHQLTVELNQLRDTVYKLP